MQGELKFIINLDFLVPVLIFLEMLVNFYLSVAEQVTFVSENCSLNLPRLGELEDLCVFVNVGQKAEEKLQRGFFLQQWALWFSYTVNILHSFVCVCVVKSRHPCAQPCEKGSGGNGIGSDDEVSISNGLREEKALRTGSRKEVGMLE